MNPIVRLGRELGQLSSTLGPRDFMRYTGALIRSAPAVLRARNLVPADLAMTGVVAMSINGAPVRVPLDLMQKALAHFDPTPTFGGAREMYAGNVYLRAFNSGLRARNVVDLGSNRGLFLALAAKVLGAERGVGVEPQIAYDVAFDALAAANDLDRQRFTRIGKLVAASSGEDRISMSELMRVNGLDRIDFLKCDIEGGEFDVFTGDNAFLERVGNIGMELHPSAGEVSLLVAALRDHAFDVRVTDQFGRPSQPQAGEYLYASRMGDLAV